MSDLEKQLAELPLTPASTELEARVLAELRVSSACSCSGGSDARSQPSASIPTGNGSTSPGSKNASVSMRKEGTVGRIVKGSSSGGFVSSLWLSCTVCLLVGTISGRLFLPASLRTNSTDSGAVTNTESSECSGKESLRTNGSAFSLAAVPEQPGWAQDGAMKTGSKIVESSWFSPSVGAVAWEQQTEEIFRVGTHRTDRRFAVCRECHRVGG